MRILADTNILVRLAQPAHQKHAQAIHTVETLLVNGDDPCIVPQVIYEFWVVATRPASANGLGMSAKQADSEISKSLAIFSLLRDERAVYMHWRGLVVTHDVRGKVAHDARLVAAMKRHGLTHLLTCNPNDFARFPGIQVLTPDGIVG